MSLTSPALPAAETIEVNIDISKTGAPINPFIYGQFIEHLGRCIYGGIWAEMLEDRKFYFPITAEYAPYKDAGRQRIPRRRRVALADHRRRRQGHDGEGAAHVFVGDHVAAPRTPATGIRQRDLGVVAGKTYDGYLWAKPADGKRAEIEVSLVWGDGPTDRASETPHRSRRDGTYAKSTFSLHRRPGRPDQRRDARNPRLERRRLARSAVADAGRQRAGHARATRWRCSSNSTARSIAGRAAISSAATTGATASATATAVRRARIPAWTGVEHNDFGTDEFIAFCREINTEPMIAVNTGFGDDYSAAQWVEYCNSGANTIGGGWRAKNGNAEPYGVKYWCVGNEMFGPGSSASCRCSTTRSRHNLVRGGDVEGGSHRDADRRRRPRHDQQGPRSRPGEVRQDLLAHHAGGMRRSHGPALGAFLRGRLPWTQNGRVDAR